MFNKIMVGALFFAVASTASLSANQLVLAANVPNEINLRTVQETTKKRFADHNVGFEVGGLNPLIKILSMPVKYESDKQRFSEALWMGLINFFAKQGWHGLRNLFAETVSLQENGFIDGSTSDVELFVNFTQRSL